MDSAHRQLIQRNLVALVENITISSIFLDVFDSKAVIAKCDRELIESLRINSEQVSKLLNLLMQRTEGFTALIKALEKTNQDGALWILNHPTICWANTIVYPKYASARSNSSVAVRSVSALASGSIENKTKNMNPQMSHWEHLIIGSEECPFTRIVNLIEDNSVGHVFFGKYDTLGRRLDIPASARKKYATDLLHDKTTTIKIFEDMLENWKIRQGSKATLTKLISAIKKSESEEIAECIQKDFERDLK